METLNNQNNLELPYNHLKDILIHSRDHSGVNATIKVPPSRFKKILSDYRSLNAIGSELTVSELAKMYDWFRFTSDDLHYGTGNVYTIIKDRSIPEFLGRCAICTCEDSKKKRWVNGQTLVCFYKEMITNNYTTKIKLEEDEPRRKSTRNVC